MTLSSVANALRVIDLLAAHGEMGVSEIGRSLGVTAPTAYRLAQTLHKSEFLERNATTRQYRLGTKILSIAEKVKDRGGLREMLSPTLRTLAEQTGETVNLGVLRGGEVTYIEKIDSSELFRIEVRVGARVPAYCAALGKAILSALPKDEVLAHLKEIPIKAHTPATLTSVRAILAELEHVRAAGYATDKGELLADVWCVAAPVLGESGRPVAAISISAPRSRFESKRERLVSLVVKSAQEASTLVSPVEPLLREAHAQRDGAARQRAKSR